jgi:beta-galactosidase
LVSDGTLTGAYTAGDTPRARATISLDQPTDGDGRKEWYALSVRAEIDEAIRDLPRVGLRFVVPSGFETLEWYGRGPHESYPDRAHGAWLARHRSTVSLQYVPYVVPQEHGGHTDVRCLTLSDGSRSLSVAADGVPFHFSALHTAAEDIDTLTHSWQIEPREEIILSVDAYHRGIGTAACGPDAHPRWIRGGGVFEWRWWVRVARD